MRCAAESSDASPIFRNRDFTKRWSSSNFRNGSCPNFARTAPLAFAMTGGNSRLATTPSATPPARAAISHGKDRLSRIRFRVPSARLHVCSEQHRRLLLPALQRQSAPKRANLPMSKSDASLSAMTAVLLPVGKTPKRISTEMNLFTSNTVLAALAAAVLSLATPAGAQTRNVQVAVPFNFVAGDQLLRAGEYRIDVDDARHILTIAPADAGSVTHVR